VKVLRLHDRDKLRLHEESDPVTNQDEYLLRVTAVGLCGSDLLWLDQGGIGDARLDKPLILGHEFAGIIESGDQNGQRVAVDPAIPCMRCRYCLEGNPNLCKDLRFAGHGSEDGALREKMNWPKLCVHSLPDILTDVEGVMLEPLGVALHALDLARVQPGMTVGVFGCGPIGLLLIQLAKAAGATRIIATDPLIHRLDAAKAVGSTFAILASDGKEREEVWSAAGGDGLDLAFEAAGENEAVETAIQSTRPGRQVILIGIPKNDQTMFTASVARRKGLTIKIVRRMKHTYPRAIDLVQNRYVDVQSLVTHRFPFYDFDAAFASAKNREGIKVIIEF
jgi:L-iditol 2-dehydrogenase